MNANYISFLLESLGYPPPSSPSHIKIGDKVRVKASVTTPKYKWGSVTHQSVGVVKGSTTSQENSQVFSFSSTIVNSFFFFPIQGQEKQALRFIHSILLLFNTLQSCSTPVIGQSQVH